MCSEFHQGQRLPSLKKQAGYMYATILLRQNKLSLATRDEPYMSPDSLIPLILKNLAGKVLRPMKSGRKKIDK